MEPLLEVGKLYKFYYKYHKIVLGPIICLDCYHINDFYNRSYKVFHLDMNKIEYMQEGGFRGSDWVVTELTEATAGN